VRKPTVSAQKRWRARDRQHAACHPERRGFCGGGTCSAVASLEPRLAVLKQYRDALLLCRRREQAACSMFHPASSRRTGPIPLAHAHLQRSRSLRRAPRGARDDMSWAVVSLFREDSSQADALVRNCTTSLVHLFLDAPPRAHREAAGYSPSYSDRRNATRSCFSDSERPR
jgi:hypothetical protein